MKNVLITGASGLIGSELCREFLELGFGVYGLDLKNNPTLKDENYHFLKCDISKEDQVKAAFKKIKKGLDIVINNGAVADPINTKLEKLSLKEWNQKLATNLTSVFLISKYAVPKLKKSKGNIINISSSRHIQSEPHNEIYCAAKGGIDGLTRAMAISLGPEIRVNSISPGWIADSKGNFSKEDHEQHPTGRVGKPSDVAGMVLYLASEKAGFVTGQDFVIDGGMTVKMIYK